MSLVLEKEVKGKDVGVTGGEEGGKEKERLISVSLLGFHVRRVKSYKTDGIFSFFLPFLFFFPFLNCLCFF